jgi:hypothetical protein
MGEGNSLINLGDISKPATVLIEKISDAVGGVFKPYQIRRVAQAEAEAEKIHEVSRLEVTDLQRRALHRFVYEEPQKQANIEGITQLALPEVTEQGKPEELEKDWIADFFDKCRLISNEEMQQLWAKVLAGEANNPGSYSKRTITLLSTLDKSDAELFQRFCSVIWTFGPTNLVPLIFDPKAKIYMDLGLTFVSLTHLNDLGLINFNSIMGISNNGLPQKVLVWYYGNPVGLHFPKPEKNTLNFGHAMLTKAGHQLAPICASKPGVGFLEYVLEVWNKQGVQASLIKPDSSSSTPPKEVAS